MCFHRGKNNVLSDDIKNRGKPYGHPFRSSEYPGLENVMRYGLVKCKDCGGWFPWFGGW